MILPAAPQTSSGTCHNQSWTSVNNASDQIEGPVAVLKSNISSARKMCFVKQESKGGLVVKVLYLGRFGFDTWYCHRFPL